MISYYVSGSNQTAFRYTQDTTGSVSTIQYKGTVQVFAQETASYFVSASNKVNYTTQNDTSLSYTSSNEYIIL